MTSPIDTKGNYHTMCICTMSKFAKCYTYNVQVCIVYMDACMYNGLNSFKIRVEWRAQRAPQRDRLYL